jgi:hypothetical protein
MSIKNYLVTLILFIINALSVAADVPSCLDPSLAAVSGLVPGMDGTAIHQVEDLLSVETSDGEDDSGTYTAYTYHFAHYDIDVVYGMIDVIDITRPEFKWTGKIQIGSERKQVIQQMGINPIVDDEDASQYVICSDAGYVYAILGYKDNRVTKIQLVLDRP